MGQIIILTTLFLIGCTSTNKFSFERVNLGNIENKGFEISIDAKIISNPEALSLLFIIPILAIWYFGNNKKRQGSMLVTTTHFLSDIKTFKTWSLHFPFRSRSWN